MPSIDDKIASGIRMFMEEQIPFNKYLGLRVKHLEWGRATLEIPFREEFIGDPFRPALHGGVISMLLDTCGGAAVFTQFASFEDRTSTVDLRIDYLRPGQKETLLADAEVIRAGNRVAVVDITAYHPGERERPVALGKGVYNMRRMESQGS